MTIEQTKELETLKQEMDRLKAEVDSEQYKVIECPCKEYDKVSGIQFLSNATNNTGSIFMSSIPIDTDLSNINYTFKKNANTIVSANNLTANITAVNKTINSIIRNKTYTLKSGQSAGFFPKGTYQNDDFIMNVTGTGEVFGGVGGGSAITYSGVITCKHCGKSLTFNTTLSNWIFWDDNLDDPNIVDDMDYCFYKYPLVHGNTEYAKKKIAHQIAKVEYLSKRLEYDLNDLNNYLSKI